ncbi:MAG: hypothetical protein Fur005_32350 [Roseiflexaceae bacterium]
MYALLVNLVERAIRAGICKYALIYGAPKREEAIPRQIINDQSTKFFRFPIIGNKCIDEALLFQSNGTDKTKTLIWECNELKITPKTELLVGEV